MKIDQYSSSEISEAHDEILKWQENLNKIEQIGNSINQTETNLEKGGFDLHEILQIRQKKDERQCFIIIFICIVACFFLLIVISVLINVIQTFGSKRITKSIDNW